MGKVREAADQIRGYVHYLFDPEKNLFFHIIDTGTGRFVRRKHWATGNGWAVMGLSRVTEEANRQGYAEISGELTGLLKTLLDAMISLQLPDGRFHDILDDPESFADGTSALMMAAGIYRAILYGILDQKYASAADRAVETAEGMMDEYGLIRGVCGCPHFISEGTSAEAQAAFVMAEAWKGRVDLLYNRRY